jgi:hypothetical protein
MMEKIGFESYGFQTVFGFTGSVFIRHAAVDNTITTDSSKQEHIAHFLEVCQNQLNIKLEYKNRFLFTTMIRRIAILLGLVTLQIEQS